MRLTCTIGLAWVVATLAACSAAPVAPSNAPPAASSATAAPTATAGPTAAAAPDSGGDASEEAGVAPSLADLRAAAMSCESEEEGEIDGGCEAYERWIQDEAPFANGAANQTLLEMIASPDPKARRLAADKLRVIDESSLAPSAFDTVLGAAEQERVVPVVKAMAELVAGFDLVKAGQLERAVAIARSHPVADFAETFLLHAGWSNRHQALLDYAIEASRSPSSSLRNAALQTASKHTADFARDACKVVNALRADKDKFVANRARTLLAEASGCRSTFDRLLDELAAVNVTKDVDQSFGSALHALCRNKGLSDKQRERAAKAARRISDAKAVHANTRYYTLSAVVGCDPKEGVAFVARFKTDPDSTVASRAAELTK